MDGTRKGYTKRITVNGFDIYITVNNIGLNKAGEVFIKISKQGSTISALIDALAATMSLALQNGVPWKKIREHYLGTKFEPLDEQGRSILHRIAETIEELSVRVHQGD